MKRTRKWMRLLALVLCLGIVLSTVPVLAASNTAIVTGNGKVHLRKSASLGSKILGSYSPGTEVTVLDEGSTWTKISVNGKTGYMMTRYLSSGKTSGKIMYVRTYTGVKLRLRARPTVLSAILGAYTPGTAVQVIDRGRSWTKVRVDGMVGYMGSQYLTSTKP